ncbi:MAG TPA: hypothetical protein VG651_25570 [Stellaceae bacterium]|nr:hypothetical protein [Stellaceae bacterium]
MAARPLARALFGAAAIFLLTSAGAFACLGKSDPALDDNFAEPDPGWPNGDNVATTPQGLVVKPPVNGSTWVANSNYTMDGSDLCVTVALPATLPTPANEDTVGDVGVLFWKRDNDNYYMAAMSPDGIAVVSRYLNGQWLTIVNAKNSPAIKTGAGAVNELEVTAKGNAGSFYINGTKIGDFRGQAPPGGGPPGVYAESGPNVTTWVFSRVQLYSLPQ